MAKVGLALGSGGVKGIAHIGVLKVFEENGIPVDFVSGSSAGAIIGGIYAAGTDLDMLSKFVVVMDSKEYLDMQVPRVGRGGIMKGDALEELVRVFTHGKSFKQTRVPFYCVAVDVETGELLTFSQADDLALHDAIRASMAIPGVFSPKWVQNHLCVDGAVLERVPCAALRDAGADIVIGVDVGSRGETRRLEQVTMFSVLENALDIMQWEQMKQKTNDADVMICPDVRDIMKPYSTAHAQECIEEGKRAANEALPKILKLLEKHDVPLKSARRL